ncbi:MAG: hypothetical protein RL710_447, partial [Pseudomonadota bacterium]
MIDLITNNAFGTLISRFLVNAISMILLMFVIYYPRYRNKELVTSAALFNIFIFSVLTVLSKAEFGVAGGFGLFAILALFTLRSEQISKIEITYFFGSVSIAVICAVQGTTLPLMVAIATLVLIGTFIIDHPKILHSVSSLNLTLDKIESCVLADPSTMIHNLSQLL